MDRANAARRIMRSAGLNEAQLQQVRGWADRQPRDPDHPEADSNRRVTVTMLLPPVTVADTLTPPGDSLPPATAAASPPAEVTTP